ncbi:PadR family transcriptional regulator [Neobacillus notoginsengisoli]|uniref:PadR family transcriptional regulator n=1 Tax=Neobacillus notoginsengisoli TaxID=1578198 RepID=A0A417YER3_9BACI|nr:PadR family transcriptional regulator [Neobacillus notoginsengisoli]RHW31145.1 PadR family transcriptional regulator [Neobacillus notoginsengisoli]
MSIEHTILAVISFKPKSGYDIKAEFEHKGAGLFWEMSYGSIYPKLKKLEESGWIKAYENNLQGRKRVLYELTREGWDELENWLYKTPEYPLIKDELLMKMASWHEDLDARKLIAHLEKRKEKSQELLAFVNFWPNNGTSYVSGIGKLALRYEESRLRAEIEWIEDTISALEKGDLPAPQDPFGLAEEIKQRRKDAHKGASDHEG